MFELEEDKNLFLERFRKESLVLTATAPPAPGAPPFPEQSV